MSKYNKAVSAQIRANKTRDSRKKDIITSELRSYWRKKEGERREDKLRLEGKA